MIFNSRKSYEFASDFIFLMFFPLTFVYILASMYLFKLPAEAFYVSLLATILFVLFYEIIDIDRSFLLALVLFLYCLFYSLFHYSVNDDLLDWRGQSMFGFNIKNSLYCFVFYLAGRFFRPVLNKYQLIIYFFLIFPILYFTNYNNFSLDVTRVLSSDLYGSYLRLSDIFAIYSIVLIGLVSRLKLKVFLFAVAVYMLFILNSRSSLYLFVFIFGLYVFLFYKFTYKLYAFIFLLLAVLLIGLNFDYLISVNPRMMAFVSGESDESFRFRLIQFDVGLSQIAFSPLWGDYSGAIKYFGSLGSYMHNILSFWHTYGLFAFVLVFYLFIYQGLQAIYYSFSDKVTKEHSHIVFMLSLYLVLLVLTSKSYVWIYAWFCLGVIHGYLKTRESFV